MIAQNNEFIKEATGTVYQLTQEERIRMECEAREDFYRTQRGIQDMLDESAAKLEAMTAEKEAWTLEKKSLVNENQNLTIENQSLSAEIEKLRKQLALQDQPGTT